MAAGRRSVNKVIIISQKNIRAFSFTYLMLPLLIFLLGFLKPMFGIICGIALLCVWRLSITSKGNQNDIRVTGESESTIRIWEIVFLAMVSLVWCILGGQGGYFYQTSDWNERNAIFRDLIEREWPVYYDQTDTVLTYYIGHWLPAALVGKAVYILSGSAEIAWKIGNNALLLWSSLGIIACLLLLFRVSRANTFRQRSIAVLIFVFFSGLDVIGTILQGWGLRDYFEIMHLEWWAGGDVYQYSSTTTGLFWVFNQAITAWIAALSFIHENRRGITCRNYGYIVVASLISSPLPTVGLFFIMAYAIVYSAVRHLKGRQLKAYFRDLISPGNVLIVLFVFPVLALFLFGNSAVENTAAPSSPPAVRNKVIIAAVMFCLLVVLPWFVRKRGPRRTMRFLASSFFILLIAYYLLTDTDSIYPVFILLDVGIYIFLLFPNEQRNYLFHAASVLLLLAPLLKIGIGADFCMRASIPALIVVMFLCIKRVIHGSGKGLRGNAVIRSLCGMALIIALLIGACTPMMEIYRGFARYQEGVADDIYTLNKYHSSGGIYGNFVSDSYQNSFFFTRLTDVMENRK